MGDPECDRALDKVPPTTTLKWGLSQKDLFRHTDMFQMYSLAGGHSKNIGGGRGREESKRVIIFMGIFKSDNAKSHV